VLRTKQRTKQMKQTYIDTPEDITWLRDVHCHDLPLSIQCAIIHGNEDAPSKVVAWVANNPHFEAKPNYVWEDTWSEETLCFLPCFPTMGDDSDWIEYQYGNEQMLTSV